MKQLTLAAVGFERYAKTTRRAAFLGEGGRGWAVVGFVWPDRAVLPEAGQWPSPGRGRADAAYLLLAAMVQSVGPGGGGGVIRFGGDAGFCRHRSRPRAGAGRDHGVPLPPPARDARSGPAAVRRGAAALGGPGNEGGRRHDRRRDDHQRAVLDQERR